MKPLITWKVPTINSMMAAKVTQPTQPVGSGAVVARVARRVTGVEPVAGEGVLPVSDIGLCSRPAPAAGRPEPGRVTPAHSEHRPDGLRQGGGAGGLARDAGRPGAGRAAGVSGVRPGTGALLAAPAGRAPQGRAGPATGHDRPRP